MTNKKDLIWITGGTSGIGLALVETFLNNNKIVLATSGNIEKLNNIKENFNNCNLYTEVCNVKNKEEINAISEKYLSSYNFDCLINNAGITSFKSFYHHDYDEIDSIIDTNLKGSIYSIKTVLPNMIQNKSGSIINILSIAAKKIFLRSSIYSASKEGLLAFTNVLREELREHNIKVINIVPGPTNTPIWNNNVRENYGNNMMLPKDIAEMIYSLYKNKSSAVPEELILRPITGDL
ncbi:MAG: SDR family oxidoreductase [bacterium]